MSGIDLLRAGWGATELIFAERVARDELDHPGDRVTIAAFRILGVRQLVQGVLTHRSRSRAVSLAGGGVDILHALSMLVIAALSPARRRAALINGAIAGLFARAEFRHSAFDARIQQTGQRPEAIIRGHGGRPTGVREPTSHSGLRTMPRDIPVSWDRLY